MPTIAIEDIEQNRCKEAGDTRNKAPAAEDVMDPNATPRPVRAQAQTRSGSGCSYHAVPVLNETAMPALTPSASEGELDIDREDMEPVSVVCHRINRLEGAVAQPDQTNVDLRSRRRWWPQRR